MGIKWFRCDPVCTRLGASYFPGDRREIHEKAWLSRGKKSKWCPALEQRKKGRGSSPAPMRHHVHCHTLAHSDDLSITSTVSVNPTSAGTADTRNTV